MRRATILSLLALAALSTGASASAAPVDTHSAHTALRDYRAYLSGLVARMDAASQSDDLFINGIATTCPGVLKPLNTSNDTNQTVLTQFGKEVGADLVLAAIKPLQKPVATFGRRVGALHWSSRAQTRRIKTSLADQATAFALPPSDLCADASALVANGGKSAAPGTAPFLKTFVSTTVRGGLAAVKGAIKRYRPASDRALLRRVMRLENSAGNQLEGTVDSKVRTLLNALGLTF